MQNNRYLVIFARAPSFGRGKRRLAKDIGELGAYHFYKKNLNYLLKELKGGRWRTHISLASAQDAKHPLFNNLCTSVQVQGDMGDRMRSVLQEFKNEKVIIIGSDVHGVTKSHIEASFSALTKHDLVFGPAFDGGFWLIGCGALRPVGWRFMHGVRWSTEFALRDTLNTIPSGYRVAQVAQLHDIDDGASFDKCYRRHDGLQR